MIDLFADEGGEKKVHLLLDFKRSSFSLLFFFPHKTVLGEKKGEAGQARPS